ncbi:MAG TPA: RNA polymerase subunit sigma [Rhodospirillaceae bacterium]|jgi:RNA polymerase sigma-70 factor (ECF subfamily)|nr:sigma-70 family RNA polymerase sigma factor [Alphaproteobacteria bacterium]HBH26309.1 RNA polymerase subunit sigma [Rhodospirillaceae bacterium]
MEHFAQDLCAVGKTRDKDAFVRLFKHFAPRVKAFFLARGLAEGEADDLAQEVLLRLWRKAPLYDPTRAAPATWIFAIARHKYVDMLRMQATQAAAATALGDLPPPPEEGPDSAFLAGESHAALAEALATLPKDLTEVLRLSFFDGLAHGAIAARTGLPLGTVKSRIRRAMEFLRASGALEGLR